MKKILFLVCLCSLMGVFANACIAGGLTVSANCNASPTSYAYGFVSEVGSGLSFPIGAKFYTGKGGGVALNIEANYLWKLGSSLFGGSYYGYYYLVTGDNKCTGITSFGLKLVIGI